jgi:hypothetical protein
MILLTTISIVGSSVAGSALADPYHHAAKARYSSGANASNAPNGAGYAAFGEVDQSNRDFDTYASGPRYHGGPKASY